MSEFLTDVELDVIFYIERFHASMGQAPTVVQLNQRFTGLTPDWHKEFAENPLVKKSFAKRGIIFPAAEDKFTAQQLHAAVAMLDTIDRRSDEKKLRDIGVTTRQWATWVLDDDFAGYLRDRSERLLENSNYEAHKGLIKGVRNGNVASIKTMYEITGRHDPTKEVQIDIRRVLHTFIEVLQKNIKDPILLHNIGMQLSQVADAESFSTSLSSRMASSPPPQVVRSSAIPNSLPMPEVEDFE